VTDGGRVSFGTLVGVFVPGWVGEGTSGEAAAEHATSRHTIRLNKTAFFIMAAIIQQRDN
jgi:hypothetical protein